MKILLVLLFGLVLAQSLDTVSCDEYIQNLITQIKNQNYSVIPTASILYSGLAPNCPGQLIECQEDLSHNYSYYLTYQKADFSDIHGAGSKDLLGYFVGLCLPKQCSQEDIKNIAVFQSAEVFGYGDEGLGAFAWISLVSFIIYLLIIVAATLINAIKEIRSPKTHKPAPSSTAARLSINDTDEGVNRSTGGESMHEPLLGYGHQEHKTESLVACFSAYENYTKVFHVAPNRNILYGPKCIAVLMIVVAYEYSMRQTVAMNHKTAATLLSTSLGYVITNVELAFATLFWIFGINAAYALYKVQSFRDITKAIGNKLIKTWMIVVLFVLFAYGFMKWSISQPLNKVWQELYTRDCSSIFWRKWLLINPLVPDETTCLPWTWVFEVEILLYILSPIFIIALKGKKWLGYVLLSMVILCSIIFSFVVLQVEHIPFFPSLLFNNSHQYVYLFQMNPLTRASQFYFGLLIGLFINHALDKVDESNQRPPEYKVYKFLKNSRIHQTIMQLLGLAFVCTSFFLIASVNDEHSRSAYIKVFVVLIPFVMLVGLTLLVIPSFFQGKGHLTRLINNILASNFWSPLYKLSNTIYLVAPLVIGLTTYSLQTGIYFSYEEVTLLLIGDLALILFFSILVCCVLEYPFHQLQRMIQHKSTDPKGKESLVQIDE